MKAKLKVFMWSVAIHAGVSLLLLICMTPMVFFRVAESFPLLWLIYRAVGIILAPVIGAMYVLNYEAWSNPFVFTFLIFLNSCLWGLIGTGLIMATRRLRQRRTPDNTSNHV